jgi:hypothetical protein
VRRSCALRAVLADYLPVLSRLCRADLTAPGNAPEHAPEFLTLEYLEPREKNFCSWSIVRGGLGFSFDRRTVRPCVDGVRTAFIPFVELTDFVDPTGPIGKFGP